MYASNQYSPATPAEAAKLLGVTNQETFNRKFLEKTGTRISELPQGKIPNTEFLIIAQHFAKNYPQAADVLTNLSSDADETSGRADDKRTINGRQTDDKRTANGRTDDTNGRETDGRTITDDSGRADEINGRLQQLIDNQQIALLSSQNRIDELEKLVATHNKSSQQADAINGRQADEVGRKTDEISRLKQLLADERTEIGRLKQALSDEKTSGRADEMEKQFTVRLAQSKAEWEKQERMRRADERTKSDESIFALRFEVSQKQDDLKILQAELNRYKEVSKSFDFKIKSLWRQELDTINITSNILAIYGFTLLFGVVGIITVFLMIMFFKNTIKNLKISKREISARFGMRIAIGIECIYGFFHYTTFFDILKNKTASLLFKDAHWVSVGMMVIVSGLSIAALMQSRKQTKDDIS